MNKIDRWGYDSYSYDEIWDYIEENNPKQIENDIWGHFSDAQSWNDIDFVLGIAIYRIRTGVVLQDKTLRKLREIIDDILERSPFEEWDDKNKRIIKLQHERRIINAILKKIDFKFGEIIPKPNLNPQPPASPFRKGTNPQKEPLEKGLTPKKPPK